MPSTRKNRQEMIRTLKTLVTALIRASIAILKVCTRLINLRGLKILNILNILKTLRLTPSAARETIDSIVTNRSNIFEGLLRKELFPFNKKPNAMIFRKISRLKMHVVDKST
jgi:hypothetical protein